MGKSRELNLIHRVNAVATALSGLDDSFLPPELRHKPLLALVSELTDHVQGSAAAREAYRNAVAGKVRAMAEASTSITRVVAAVHGQFGENSPEFETVSGRRGSRRRSRKTAKGAASTETASTAPAEPPRPTATATITMPAVITHLNGTSGSGTGNGQ